MSKLNTGCQLKTSEDSVYPKIFLCHSVVNNLTNLTFLVGAVVSSGESSLGRFSAWEVAASDSATVESAWLDSTRFSSPVWSCVFNCCTRQSIALNIWSASLGFAYQTELKYEYSIVSDLNGKIRGCQVYKFTYFSLKHNFFLTNRIVLKNGKKKKDVGHLDITIRSFIFM